MTEPDMLHHYTGSEGLLGILGQPTASPEIWLTQIQYMNDNREWWHAFELMRNAMISMHSGAVTQLQELARHFDFSSENYRRDVTEWGGMQRSFVFSFSEEPDLLSQWRGYVPNGGYSVGFATSSMRNLAIQHGFTLIRCIYDDDEKKKVVDSLLECASDLIRAEWVNPDALFPQTISDKERVLGSAWGVIQTGFSHFGTFFKHSSFREEKEWRLVGVVPAGNTDSRARWRTRRDLILPYCSLPLQPEQSPKQIIVGPGVDYILAKHALQFLRFPENIRIERSASTLRR